MSQGNISLFKQLTVLAGDVLPHHKVALVSNASTLSGMKEMVKLVKQMIIWQFLTKPIQKIIPVN